MRRAHILGLGSMIPLAAMLAGCGGSAGGASLSSTPTPPAAATYTKIADLSGDRTFQTAGIQYNTAPSVGFTGASTFAFGSGVTVAYTAASDSYRLTAPDGSTATFDPSNVQAGTPVPNGVFYVKTTGTTRDQFTISAPSVAGVPLSYTVVGAWGRIDTTTNNGVFRLAVGGAPTIASDMPKTGTATYNTAVGGSAVMPGGAVPYTLTGNSSATFSANFATGSIATALTLAGPLANATSGPVTSFGTFNGTGTIAAGSPGFTGTITGTGATGVFSGAFFGPQAAEMGYNWAVTGSTFNAVGSVTGVKN